MVAPSSILTILTGGPWILQNRTIIRDGIIQRDPDHPMGLSPAGIILYHPTHYMSATMASTNTSHRPTTMQYPYESPTDIEQWALVGVHSLCYTGPFSFTGRNEVPGKLQGEIMHGPVVMSNMPDWLGTEQLRNFTIFEEGRGRGGKMGWTLRLTALNAETGGTSNIWWKRG